MSTDDFKIKGRDKKEPPQPNHHWPASTQRLKARQCTSKRRFRDMEEAKTVLRTYPEQRIYPCVYCGGFHLTKGIYDTEQK